MDDTQIASITSKGCNQTLPNVCLRLMFILFCTFINQCISQRVFFITATILTVRKRFFKTIRMNSILFFISYGLSTDNWPGSSKLGNFYLSPYLPTSKMGNFPKSTLTTYIQTWLIFTPVTQCSHRFFSNNPTINY